MANLKATLKRKSITTIINPDLSGETVTSVGLAGSEFTVTGSPITTSGIIELEVNAIASSKITGLSTVATSGNYLDLTLNVGLSPAL